MKLLSRSALVAAPIVAAFALAGKKTKAIVREVDNAKLPSLDARLATPTDVEHREFGTSDGGSVHYIDTHPDDRTRPTVVLCHGVSAQWWVWSAVIDSLRADHRVIAWDMRGHGKSSAGSDGVTIAAAGRDIKEILEFLDLHEVVICGHSMGGMELGRFMADYPAVAMQRLAGACFLATSANTRTGTLRTGGWAYSSGAINKLGKLAGDRPPSFSSGSSVAVSLMRAAFGPTVSRRMIDDQIRCQNEFLPRSNREAGAALATHNVEAQLRKNKSVLASIPTSVISGSHDRLTPPIHGRGIVAALPHASWTELSQCGHNIMLEDPDSVIDALRLLRTR
jgi:pimeloyl-ACP methyl ester carboxylesterase